MTAHSDTTTDHRERGVALFVVLVVVIILSVVVSQLVLTTKIEERVSEYRLGETEIQYSFQSVARVVMSRLYDDALLSSEQAAAGEEDEGGVGSNPGPAPGGPGQDPAAGPSSGASTDSRHEEWRRQLTEEINEVEVTIVVRDGESLLDVNRLFEYVQVEDELDDELNDPANANDPIAPPPSAVGPDGEELDGEEEEEEDEYPLPSPERIERTIEMMTRLVEGVVQRNQENGFFYTRTPNPDFVAEEIVQFMFERRDEGGLGPVYNLETLLRMRSGAVDWELLYGPIPPPLEDDEEEDEGFEDERQTRRDRLAELNQFGGLDEFAPGGFDDFYETGELPGYEEVEEGFFVELPKPLGLADVIGTFSTGKLNCNTARPEIIYALLLDLDPDTAWEMSVAIDDHLNSYPDAEEEQDVVGTRDAEEEAEALGGADSPFNVFQAVADMVVDELWDERGAGEETSPASILIEAMDPIATFQSTFFIARLEGSRGDQVLQGEVVLTRYDGTIRVLSWRDLSR